MDHNHYYKFLNVLEIIRQDIKKYGGKTIAVFFSGKRYYYICTNEIFNKKPCCPPPMSVHAEIEAYTKLSKRNNIKRNKSYDMLVLKISKNGTMSNSKPCKHCYERLLKSDIKIRNIYYSYQEDTIKKEKMVEMNSTYISKGYRNKFKN
jgi:hypothetical protein